MLFKWILLTSIFTFTSIAGKQTLVATRYVGTSELLIWESSKTFDKAQNFCAKLGGSLVKISNININNAIHDDMRFRKIREIWIGATDKQNENQWKWTDGSNVEFTKWDSGQPDDHLWKEDCVTITTNGKWNDEDCGSHLGFVCQKEFNLTTYPPRLQNGAHSYDFYVLYEDQETFYAALKSCMDKDSRLVEVATQQVEDYLKQQINFLNYGSTFRYWTGGSDLMNTNSWWWNNRTKMSTDWGWRPGEPNVPDHHCVIGNSEGLIDRNCDEKFAYVCEQVKVDRSNLVVLDDSDKKEIVCYMRDAYPVASVAWFFGGAEVALFPSYSAFQTKAENRATLHTENITIAEEGNYTCSAANTIGYKTYNAGGQTSVKVSTHPNITVVTQESCNLLITWSPNMRAIGIKHRITVSSGADKFTSMITPTSEKPSPYVTPKLESSTSYDIQITPCPNDCRTEFSVSQNVVTVGPPEVQEASVLKVGPSDCKITWKPPTLSVITGHTITILESLATSSKNGILKTASIGPNTTYLFHGKPNRRYSFGVQVVTCAGEGPSPRLTDTCITEKQAPFEVPNPVVPRGIDEKGKASLLVPIPDQRNGPLSCLFVMIRPNGSLKSNPVNSLEELRTANATSPGGEYIAVALTATRLNTTAEDIILGDGESTSCNVHSLTSSRKRRSTNSTNDGIFVGRNKKLDPQSIYSVYIVSTTPSGENVFVKSSEMQTLQNNTTEGISLYILIASIVGSLFLIAIIVCIVIFVNRRKRNSNTRIEEQSDEQAYEYPTIPMPLQEEPGYEVVEHIHPRRELGVSEDSAYETYDDRQAHPVSKRRVEAASPPRGEGEYEVPMKQYEEIK